MDTTTFDYVVDLVNKKQFADMLVARAKKVGATKSRYAPLYDMERGVLSAKVFTLSEEFVVTAYDIGRAYSDRLPMFAGSSKPPFKKMFVNDNINRRLRRAREVGSLMGAAEADLIDDSLLGQGYFIEYHGGYASVLPLSAVHVEKGKADLMVTPLPFRYVYSYDGSLPDDVLLAGKKMARDVDFRLAKYITDSHMGVVSGLLGLIGEDAWVILSDMYDRVAIVPSEISYALWDGGGVEVPDPEYRELRVKLLREVVGDMRYLLSVLMLMNEVPVLQEERENRGRLHTVGRSSLKRDDRYVRLNLFTKKGKPATLKQIWSVASHGMRRRHDVRGHWMYFGQDDKCTGLRDCEWPRQFAKQQVCGHCGCHRTWRDPHKRGSGPEISKEYLV